MLVLVLGVFAPFLVFDLICSFASRMLRVRHQFVTRRHTNMSVKKRRMTAPTRMKTKFCGYGDACKYGARLDLGGTCGEGYVGSGSVGKVVVTEVEILVAVVLEKAMVPVEYWSWLS